MNHLLAEQKREIRGRYVDYDDVKSKAERYDALVATTQPIEEQAADLTAKLATRDRDVSDRDITIERYRLAGVAQLPADLWDMVGGTDQATINANIEKLKRHMGPGEALPDPSQQPQQTPRRPLPTPGQGSPSPSGDGKGGGTLSSGRELYQSSRKKKSGASTGA